MTMSKKDNIKQQFSYQTKISNSAYKNTTETNLDLKPNPKELESEHKNREGLSHQIKRNKTKTKNSTNDPLIPKTHLKTMMKGKKEERTVHQNRTQERKITNKTPANRLITTTMKTSNSSMI